MYHNNKQIRVIQDFYVDFTLATINSSNNFFKLDISNFVRDLNSKRYYMKVILMDSPWVSILVASVPGNTQTIYLTCENQLEKATQYLTANNVESQAQQTIPSNQQIVAVSNLEILQYTATNNLVAFKQVHCCEFQISELQLRFNLKVDPTNKLLNPSQLQYLQTGLLQATNMDMIFQLYEYV